MRLVSTICAFFFLLGCGANQTAQPIAVPATPEPDDGFRMGPMPTSYGSEIGGLSQEDVEEQFQSLQPSFARCVSRASSGASWFGGRVSVRMRLDPAGHVRWAYLTDTTLGDRDAERCLLDIIRSRTWPRPLSGDGLAESTFEVEPGEAPDSWPRFKASALASRAREATRSCWETVEGKFTATAYVEPDGRIIAAGVAPPDEEGEAVSDCIAGALEDLRVSHLTRGQQSTAKVSFTLP